MRKAPFTILLLLWFLSPGIYAQTGPSDTTIISSSPVGGDEQDADILSDTTVFISSLSIPADSVHAWKLNKRFAYMQHIDSLLKLKKQEELQLYSDEPSGKPNSFLVTLVTSGIVRVIFWCIVIGFVLFILYKLLVSGGVFGTRSASRTIQETTEEVEAELVMDHDKMVRQALQQSDYRMAVRYLFLKTLSRLKDKEFIHYSADKTNYQYVQEVPSEKRNDFASLVLNYEYVWYGNFSLTKEMYTGIENRFGAFNHKI